MTATSDSTDPVQTIVDLLDGSAVSKWSGTKPEYIEPDWESSENEKRSRSRDGPAAYASSPAVGPQDSFSADADVKIQTETVTVEIRSLGHATGTDTASIASDVVSILEDYWHDSKEFTEWNRIQPQETDDQRADSLARRADQEVINVTVSLERETSIGT